MTDKSPMLLHPWQRKMVEAALSGKRLVLLAPRRPDKRAQIEMAIMRLILRP